MSNTLFLVSDVWANLRRGIVVFSESRNKHSFYTANEELVDALNKDGETRFDDDGIEILPSSALGDGKAYNLLTKKVEEILPANFGGAISTVAFAEWPALKDDETEVKGRKSALLMGETTGAISVSTDFLAKFNNADMSLKDIGVKDDRVVVLPVFVHVREHSKLDIRNKGEYVEALYLLKQ